ncbi:MAG: LrgB family protein [Acidobacteriota bacterium]
MSGFLNSEIFILVLVIGTYIGASILYQRTRNALLHPILPSIAFIIAFLHLFHIEYAAFKEGSRIIDFLLAPSVVALGFVMYEQYIHIRSNIVSIMTALIAGSLVGIVSVIAVAAAMGASHELIATLQPKSVTTPIAIEIARNSGGLPALTAVIVIAVGIFGAVAGPFILDLFRINSPVARGLALGASAHGIGTARAIELGAVEGAVSGLAIGLMGAVTALLIPFIDYLLSLSGVL